MACSLCLDALLAKSNQLVLAKNWEDVVDLVGNITELSTQLEIIDSSCNGCGHSIARGDQVRIFQDANYHSHCFTCAACPNGRLKGVISHYSLPTGSGDCG